jgi:hypothetical protein
MYGATYGVARALASATYGVARALASATYGVARAFASATYGVARALAGWRRPSSTRAYDGCRMLAFTSFAPWFGFGSGSGSGLGLGLRARVRVRVRVRVRAHLDAAHLDQLGALEKELLGVHLHVGGGHLLDAGDLGGQAGAGRPPREPLDLLRPEHL